MVGLILAPELFQSLSACDLFLFSNLVSAKLDPFRHGAYALYNVCDPDTAVFFDTGKGHTIPRSGLVINELGDAVRDLISTSQDES